MSENDTQRTNRALTVFISYSRSDSGFVNDLANWLRTAGCTVWQDTSGLRGGETWASGIDQAVRVSEVFIVVLSPASSTSEWVRKETLLAMNLHKPIVPILLRDTDLPVQLVDLQFVDFRGEKKEARQKLFEAISTSTRSKSTLHLPYPSRRYGKALALSVLGVIALGIVGYVMLYQFNSKTGDTRSTSNQSASLSSSPANNNTSIEQPQPSPGASASVTPPINSALGTFTKKFQAKDTAFIVYGAGTSAVPFFHNIKLSSQDVGKTLGASVANIAGPSPEQDEGIRLELIRSLKGPFKGGMSINAYGGVKSVNPNQTDPRKLSWKVTQPGDYVLCVTVSTADYYENTLGPKIMIKFNSARFTVSLSDN